MDKQHYEEMVESLRRLEEANALKNKIIHLFGHCNATEELADLLLSKGYEICSVLDNSTVKHGKAYRDIPILPPESITSHKTDDAVALIVTRFYEEMNAQLRKLGFEGRIEKLVDYNTYAEYSLSQETIARKQARVERGIKIVNAIKDEYPGYFRVFCPFAALGDIYLMASYLPYFLKRRSADKCVIIVSSHSLAKVIALFGDYSVKVLEQKDLDAAIQATIYMQEEDAFIAHQDRPYVVNLHKALYIKKIPLETIYRCGVFGLENDCKPVLPTNWKECGVLDSIKKGKSVIISPYAKSVTALPEQLWKAVVEYYTQRGYELFTNVCGDEKPLPGTFAISPDISEMKSVVEWAGTFIGIRSGLCDIIRTAACEKIALYPDYYYSDTKWKAIEMYYLEAFKNIVVKEDLQWEMN